MNFKKMGEKIMNDNSRMPFGKYKNEKLANVPPDYLLWLYENSNIYGELKNYIKQNIDILKEEIEYNNKKNNK